MDIPKILERINTINQNACERIEIMHFGEDLRSLITESSKSFQCATPENGMICRINNLLPKTAFFQKLRIFTLFAKLSSYNQINANVPVTLIKLENKLYLIQNNKEKRIESSETTLDEFFDTLTIGNDSGYPLFCFKSPETDVIPIFNYDSARKNLENSTHYAILQEFIINKSNPSTITRILWKMGSKIKYFSITNRKKIIVRSSKRALTFTANLGHKSNKLIHKVIDFHYSKMLLPISQSVNNPYKVVNKNLPKKKESDYGKQNSLIHKSMTLSLKKLRDSRDLSLDPIREDFKNENPRLNKSVTLGFKEANGFLKSRIPKIIIQSENSPEIDRSFTSSQGQSNDLDNSSTVSTIADTQEERNKAFLVLTTDIESCFASEDYLKIPEVESMTEQVIDFLNNQIFYEKNLKGIVLDFVRDKNNKWYLLDCKEHITEFVAPLEIERSRRKIKQRLEIPKINENLDKPETPVSTEPDIKETIDFNKVESPKEEFIPCPFKIRSKPKRFEQNQVSEKDLLERMNKVQDKIENLKKQKTFGLLPSFNKQESIHNYYNTLKYPFRNVASPINSCEPFLNESLSTGSLEQSSPSTNKSFQCVKKHFSEAVESFDEMTMNIKMAKIRDKDVIRKYGGTEFWNKFIVSLYNKVLACDLLNKYFANSTLDSFKMIVNGMFKIVGGRINLELRRKLRTAHHQRGITIKEFNKYLNLFELTLNEMKIETEDKQGIMSQVWTMKNLICRHT